MPWTSQLDDEWDELMEDYPYLLPALERAVRTEDRLAKLERDVRDLRGKDTDEQD